MVNRWEQTLECQLDTAVSCNVMALRDFQKLVRPPLQKSNSKLTMYDGTVKHSLGKCGLQLTNRQGGGGGGGSNLNNFRGFRDQAPHPTVFTFMSAVMPTVI